MLCVFCTSFKGFDRRRAAARWASKFSSPPPPGQTCGEPWSLTPEFSMSFLLINFGWGRAIAGTNFDFSTGRLADGKNAEETLTSQQRGIPSWTCLTQQVQKWSQEVVCYFAIIIETIIHPIY